MTDIYNWLDTRIGRVDTDGNVYDWLDNRKGRVDTDGNVYDWLDNRKGRVDTDGNVYDWLDNRKGRVDTDGNVYDWLDNRIGLAKGGDSIYQVGAAYILLLRKEEQSPSAPDQRWKGPTDSYGNPLPPPDEWKRIWSKPPFGKP